jgi:hypothetical protein
MFSRRKRGEPDPRASGSPAGGPGPGVGYFRIGRIRLYQPDPVLAPRLPNGISDLAAYMKTLELAATEYFGRVGCDFGSMGVLVAVGIKPGRRVKFWCDQIEGNLPPDVWDAFVELLEGAGEKVRPDVTGPVVFAMEFLLGSEPPSGFPTAPTAWQKAATGHGSLLVPDGLFEIVFPD